MKEYILFLDESKDTPPSDYFALGGCVIEKEYYAEKVQPYIKSLKKEVFEDENVILHETELRLARKEEYRVLRRLEVRCKFWTGMENLFNNYMITVMCAVTNPKMCRTTYNSQYLNDEYFVCLEIIMENYAHFLEKNNATGSICIESTNTKANNRLHDHFLALKKRGTRLLNNKSIRERISTMDFYEKSDLNIGLQIADFIPNTIKKYANEIPQKKPTIVESIVSCLYDGQIGKNNIFGIKNLKDY